MKRDSATADRRQQVAQIDLAAVERNPGGSGRVCARSARETKACRGEVESLLGHEGAADSWIERPAAAVAAPMLNTFPSSSVLTGHPIGPYQIGALLGAGGMGNGYRPRDTQLHREVALRVLTAKRIPSV